MKKFAIASLLSLAIPLSIAPFGNAQTTSDSANNSGRDLALSGANTGPITLVGLAYQGFLEGQGIPRFNRLTDDYLSGRVTVEQIIRAGVDAGRIPANAAQDSAYVNDVDLYLQDLSRDQDGGE
jgi:hypothetical protein